MISKVLQNQDENNQQHSRLLYSMGERRPSQRKSCGSHQMAFSTSSSDLLITNRLLPKRHSSLSDTSQIKISNNSACTFLYNKEQQQECDKQQQRNSSASSSRRGGYWRKVMPDYHDSNMIPSLNDCLSLSPFRSSNNMHQQQQIWYGGRQKETYDELDHVLERYEKKQQQQRGDSLLWCNVADVCAEETSSIGTTWEEEEEEEDKKKLVIALCDGAGNFLSVPDANDSPMNNFTSLVPIKSPRQLSNGEDKSNRSSKEKSSKKNKKRPKSCKHRRKTSKKSLRSRSMIAISQPCSTTTDDSDDLMNNNNNNSSKRCSTPASCSRYDVQGMQVGEEWDPHQLTTQVQALGLSRGIMSDDDSSDNIVISVVSKPRPLPRHRTLIRPTSSTARLSTATITNNNQQQRRQQIAAVSLYELPTQQETETTTNVPAASLVANITNKIKQQATTVTSQQQQQNNRIQPQPQLLVRPLSSRTRRIPVQIIEDPFKRIVPPPNWTNVEQQKVATGGRGRSKRNVGGGSRNLNKRPMTAPTTNFSNTPPFSTHVSIIKL